MELFWTILALLLGLTAIAGSILPVLPGLPIGYIGLLILFFSGRDVSVTSLVLWGIVVAIISILDYFAAPLLTKKSGGSRAASVGSAVGIILGVFFTPIGILAGAFLGAMVGELFNDPRNLDKALRVGIYSFIGFLAGTFLKVAVSLFLLIAMIRAL